MARDKSHEKANHKRTSKPGAHSPETHAARSTSRVKKRSARAPLAVSSPFTPRSRFHGASDSEEAERFSMSDASKPTAIEIEVARLERVVIAKRRAYNLKKASSSTPSASTFSAPLATAAQVVEYFNDPRFDSLASHYPMITSRMLKDIQHRELNVKEIPRFTANFTDTDTKNAPEVKNMLQLLRPFEAFCQVVCAFAPSSVQQHLQLAMSLYRGSLMAMSDIFEFSSIHNYHNYFVTRAIRIGLDDPDVWRHPYQEAERKLQRSTASLG